MRASVGVGKSHYLRRARGRDTGMGTGTTSGVLGLSSCSNQAAIVSMMLATKINMEFPLTKVRSIYRCTDIWRVWFLWPVEQASVQGHSLNVSARILQSTDKGRTLVPLEPRLAAWDAAGLSRPTN
jgi:hypothetical protein